MTQRSRALMFALLPLLLACPGPIEGDPVGPPPDPNQPSIGFQYVGRREVVAGEWRVDWLIDRAPSVNAPTRIRFQGPGILANNYLVPLDLTSDGLPSTGFYLPPADVPPEGAVVKVGTSVLSPFTNRWESSPDYEIRIVKQTTPMDFFFGNYPGYPAEATVKAGASAGFGVTIRPYPSSRPVPTYQLIPPDGYTGDLGTLAIMPWGGDGGWRCDYSAPPQVPAPMDVKLRFQTFDPWVQQVRGIEYTIHLQP